MKPNEPTNTPEPLSAIIAEMREAAKSTDLFNGEEVGEPLIRGTKVEDWSDRIEAAAERERAEHGHREYDHGYATGVRHGREETATGNAAAMREALESAHRTLKLVYEHAGEFVQPRLAEEIIHSGAAVERVLAAPARNCDHTKDEAEELFKERFGRPWTQTEDELAAWIFDTAKGKEADNG